MGEEGINFRYVKDVIRKNVLIIISKSSHPEDHNMMSRINIFLIHLVSKNKLSNKLRIL